MATMTTITSKVIISITPDGDILFIKKGLRNGQTTSRLATFLSYDRIPDETTDVACVIAHLKLYLSSLLSSLRANEHMIITLTTHKKKKKDGNF